MTRDGGLKNLFRENLKTFDFQPIEMFLLAAGVPDLNFCVDGVEGWVELKSTSGHAVVVRPAQVGWAARRIRHGGRVFVAVRRRVDRGPRRGAPVDELWLFAGGAIGALADYGLKGPAPAGKWDGGPVRWDWDAVARVLTH